MSWIKGFKSKDRVILIKEEKCLADVLARKTDIESKIADLSQLKLNILKENKDILNKALYIVEKERELIAKEKAFITAQKYLDDREKECQCRNNNALVIKQDAEELIKQAKNKEAEVKRVEEHLKTVDAVVSEKIVKLSSLQDQEKKLSDKMHKTDALLRELNKNIAKAEQKYLESQNAIAELKSKEDAISLKAKELAYREKLVVDNENRLRKRLFDVEKKEKKK